MNVDAGFFSLGGQDVLEGKTLYVDFYDHKGPFLFFWNAFELLFGGKNGLFLWDTLSLTSVFYAVFLLAKEFGYRGWQLFSWERFFSLAIALSRVGIPFARCFFLILLMASIFT